MSAWLVENGHIDVLVNALAAHDLLDGRAPGDLGQLLWTENNRSINYRYSERKRNPRYVLHTTEAPLHPVAVLKAIGCYEYQSCERPDWDRSRAYKLVTRLRTAILEAHPELAKEVPSRWYEDRTEAAYLTHPVYDSAPWGFDDVEQAAEVNY
jgi:hypothetical protein